MCSTKNMTNRNKVEEPTAWKHKLKLFDVDLLLQLLS